MKQKLNVVKIGGNVIDDEQSLELFIQKFILLDGYKILVHGGGKSATDLAIRLDLPQKMINGRRVTDAETLKIVTMVYAGYINKNIVAQIQSLNQNAIGLSGADANLIQSHKRIVHECDYGFVGDVDQVNTILLKGFLEKDLIPVVAPITHDGKGQLLNTNADTIAQEIAKSMSAIYDVQLMYCFEKKGVLEDIKDDNSVLSSIDDKKFKSLMDNGKIISGMLPKLNAAFTALDNGVNKVCIGRWKDVSKIASGKAGTQIVH